MRIKKTWCQDSNTMSRSGHSKRGNNDIIEMTLICLQNAATQNIEIQRSTKCEKFYQVYNPEARGAPF